MSKKYSDDEIQYYTDGIFLLIKKIEENKFKIASHLVSNFEDSLNKVRLLDDKRVDPETVDGRIRALLAGLFGFEERNQLKNKYSLRTIQEAYFHMLNDSFSGEYSEMVKNKLKPHVFADFLAGRSDYVESLYGQLDDFFDHVLEFWSAVGDIDKYHLQDNDGFKVTFGGDLFPNSNDNLVSTAGLYVDTIVLPCPILRIAPLKIAMDSKDFIEILMKHILSVMEYESIVLEDLDIPLVIIQPDQNDYNHDDKVQLVRRSEAYLLSHANYLFDIKFSDVDDFKEFCWQFDTPELLYGAVKRKDRLLLATEWGKPGLEQLVELSKDDYLKYENVGGSKNLGNSFYSNIFGRFPQVLSVLENSQNYMGTPVICAETSWLYYNWLLEYMSNSEIVSGQNSKNHIVRALTADDKELSWLGNVPVETIISIRKNNQLEEVREILGKGVSELINIDGNNFHDVKYRIMDNIDSAFLKHQKQLQAYKKERLKLYGIDIPVCVSTGTIAITAAITASPLFGALAGVAGMVGLPNLMGIHSNYNELKNKEKKYNRSATGVLFSHVQK